MAVFSTGYERTERCCAICKASSETWTLHPDRLTTVLSEEIENLRALIAEANLIVQPAELAAGKEATILENSLVDVNANDGIEFPLSKAGSPAATSTPNRNLSIAKTYDTAEDRSFIRENLRKSQEKLASECLHSMSLFSPPAAELIIDDDDEKFSVSTKSPAIFAAPVKRQTKSQPRKKARKPVKRKTQSQKAPCIDRSSPLNMFSNVKMVDNVTEKSRLHPVPASKFENLGLDDAKKLLFEDGRNPNETDNNNRTFLHEAARRGDNKIVELLLKRGAVVDAVGGDEFLTPLHEAIINGRLEIVRTLLNAGASTMQRNIRGATALDMTSDENILSLLRQYRDNFLVQQTPVFNIPSRKELCLCFTSAALEIYGAGVVNLATLNLANMSFKNEISEKVTHLIVTDKICRQTPTFFAALALGKWIITGDWFVECYKKRQLVPESAYEAIGTDVDPLCGGPRLSRENNLWLLPPLFASIHVYCRDLNPMWDKDFKKILQYSGAKIVSAEPTSDDDLLSAYDTVLFHTDLDSPESKVNFLIIYDPENESQMKNNVDDKNESNEGLNTERIKTVSIFWFLDCLQSFKILPFPDSKPVNDCTNDDSFYIPSSISQALP
uniref:BRCT domain-containing protein n=1 Tax=Romanomermis culicivorax TaxID=13658 RepID=A0A915KKV2_ROMCU